ncbi:seryl-tRNA synthetase [Rhizoctonia solani]|uniref:serine--tRNA ligase n=1 Tax=Rhizoctonia solani TaxID=456999 RepID=A0A8H7LZZ1_9AGAM|nr:seryl-tRNA synthetase [Rhizoctonia solani]
MSFSLRRPSASHKLLFRAYSVKHTPPKRSTSSGILPPPKLNYEDLVHADQVTNAKDRNVNLPERTFEALRRDLEAWKTTTRAADDLRARQSHIGNSVRTAETPKESAVRKARTLRDSVNAHERELLRLEKSLLAHGLRIPNTSHPNVPLGPEPNARVVSTHGPKLIPSDPKRDHNQLNEIPGMKFFDRDAGVISSGAGFTYLRGGGALLELALITYAMGVAIRKGFEPIITPDIVRRDVADRCGFIPRDEEVKGGEESLVLAGTSEIPLAAMHAQALYNPQTLPRRTVAVGHAFRAEAGARGKDTRGLYRVHQFTKVELFSVTPGEAVKRIDGQTKMDIDKASDQELEYLRELQIELYTGLGIPFRVLDMQVKNWALLRIESTILKLGCPVEAPGEKSLPPQIAQTTTTGPLPYAHTLNGTAAAIPRLIIALIENGVRFKDEGDLDYLVLPSVLRRYWVGGDKFGEIEIHWE